MVNKAKVPIVSVVMAAHNEEPCIATAIGSIIDQTFTDWEFIIVDDGSSDATTEIIRRFQSCHDRIKLIVNEMNIGLAASLNRGIALSQGKYIARMDADDISYSERLQLQVKFLETHPEIAVVGGNANYVDETVGFLRKSNMPTTPKEIKRAIAGMNPLIHPSVLCNRDFLQAMGGYDERLCKKQDYDLWLRGCDVYQYANIEKVIMSYTVQLSKPFTTDMYGFYVRCINAYRRRNYAKGFFWAFVTLGSNIMRKFGYRQISYRKES